MPVESIFTIPYLTWAKKTHLNSTRSVRIADLPSDFQLTENQQAYVDAVQQNQPQINHAGIAVSLAELIFPIHFFDFETLNPAIPRFDGLKPFEQFPFQYSCHVLQDNGTLELHDYLHEEPTDPRLPLVEALVEHIAPVGSVVVYHKSFEGERLRNLAQIFPKYAEALLSIEARLWDQETIFKQHYRHPAFLGRTSIKKVLPVVVPGLNYNSLEVQNGAIAQAIWDAMICTEDPTVRQQLRKDLRDYCTQDTFCNVQNSRGTAEVGGIGMTTLPETGSGISEVASPIKVWGRLKEESGWRDSNPRPLRPERSALPNCATSRITESRVAQSKTAAEIPCD